MRRLAAVPIAVLFILAFALAFPAFAGGERRNAERVDFDDALIKGQTNRGQVHLIERRDSQLGSMIKTRKNYRSLIGSDLAIGEPDDVYAEPDLRTSSPPSESELALALNIHWFIR